MNIYQKTATFAPAAVGSDETKKLFAINKGERVLWASCIPLVNAAAGTSSTMTLGDGDGVTGFITSTELDIETATVGNPIAGAGAYLASSGGKVYAADDTIDVVYTANGATGAVPKVAFRVTIAREWAIR